MKAKKIALTLSFASLLVFGTFGHTPTDSGTTDSISVEVYAEFIKSILQDLYDLEYYGQSPALDTLQASTSALIGNLQNQATEEDELYFYFMPTCDGLIPIPMWLSDTKYPKHYERLVYIKKDTQKLIDADSEKKFYRIKKRWLKEIDRMTRVE